MGTSGESLLENILAETGTITATQGRRIIRAGTDVVRASPGAIRADNGLLCFAWAKYGF